jgi:cyclophilin family peptidyl-prolyl cis-trans isomerase
VLALIQQKYPNDVRIVYRHFPLVSIHDKAALAAQAAEAAGAQGKFWEMHDLLFQRQQEWVSFSVDQFQDWVIARAAELGLEKDKFKTYMLSAATQAIVQNAWDQGVAMKLPGTPFLLINGDPKLENVPLTQANLSAVIALLLLEKRQFDSCPPMSIDPLKQYVATLHTDKGDIVFELFPDKAPLAVNNFIFLARDGWYDGTTFHRVLPGFVAQAGDPTGTSIGGPGYYFINEISPNLKFDKAGVVAMANSGPDTNGSQFFITYAPAPKLDGSYTIFGQVVSGMDVVQNLTPREPSLNAPPGDKINSITIEVK